MWAAAESEARPSGKAISRQVSFAGDSVSSFDQLYNGPPSLFLTPAPGGSGLFQTVPPVCPAITHGPWSCLRAAFNVLRFAFSPG